MTEPPRDDDRRPEPGGPQPYGPSQPYGPPQPSGPPPYGAPAQQDGQPGHQYGQPQQYRPPPAGQYGPPGQYSPGGRFDVPGGTGSGPPEGRSRVGLIAGVTVVILVLIAGAVVAALTLGPRILSREAVERDVAAQFEELHGVPIEIECPDDMVLESGAEFTCTGITDEGEEVELVIAVTDPPGDAEYTWTET
jgi:hypothetical protein